MKIYFTADGHQRWLNGRESAQRQAVPTASAASEQSPGFLRKIRRAWRVKMFGHRQTQEDHEKSSAKILW
jgi:hypothetical protein